MKRYVAILLGVLFASTTITACGSAGPDSDGIRLQANAVGGGQIYYPKLSDQDTVLWFWAPW